MKIGNILLAGVRAQNKLRFNNKTKTTSIESLLPKQTRVKAWEKTGEDKETFFKRKHAHHHAWEKQKKLEKEQAKMERMKEQGKYNTGFSKYGNSNGRNSRRDEEKRSENLYDSYFDYVYGVNSVRAALMKRDPKNHNRLLYYNEIPEEIDQLCEKNLVGKYEVDNKNVLNNLCKGTGSSQASSGKIVHNNVVLETKKIAHPVISALPDLSTMEPPSSTASSPAKVEFELENVKITCKNGENPIGLYLDEIHDPHNMGAIIRSAYYLGVDFIVVSGKNCCSLSSPVLHKSSSGALEMIPIFENMKPLKFLQSVKENNWLLVSGQMRSSKGPAKKKFIDFDNLNEIKMPKLLIVGNEGEGIRTNLLNMSDYFVGIEPNDIDTRVVDSLNVSVATALLLSKICK